MFVRNHMSAPPITVAPDTDFKAAMGLMQRHRIRRLPVVDRSGMLAGIVAERDLMVAADRYLQTVADVNDVMTRRVVTVARNTPVVEAANLMIGLKIGGLPVVDASNKVLGIITETDLLKALVDMLAKPSDERRKSAKSAPPKTAGKALTRQSLTKSRAPKKKLRRRAHKRSK